MGETESENGSAVWKKFLRKHWNVLALFVLAIILIAVGAVYVFLWFVGYAESTDIVPTILGFWTMANLIAFILYAIFWELLLIGIPSAIVAAVGWLWWRRLPSEEKMESHFGRRSRTTGGGGGVSIGLFILFCIKVYVDGNWNVPIGTWTLNYVVYSLLTILIWIVVIFGIPAALAAIWWIQHEMRRKP